MRGRFLMAGVLLLASGFATPRLHGQAAQTDQKAPAFEVASIKPTKTQGTSLLMLYRGRLSATNMRLGGLIMRAYRLQAEQLAGGGPSWVNSEAFDIDARATGNVSSEQLMLMLRTLLAERFKLRLRPETKELPIYVLTMSRGDTQLGPKLKRSSGSGCVHPLLPGEAPKAPSDPAAPTCGLYSPLGHWIGRATTIDSLAAQLSMQSLHRAVVNRTGLTGTFDLDLQWADLAFLFSPQASPSDPPLTDGPSLFTALQEQLGLTLESTKGPVDVLVIDHVEKPTPD
jgi:uncharacterized protein (TIGR03435 family)